jgi:hypothetical protein
MTSGDILQKYYRRLQNNRRTLDNIESAYRRGFLIRRDLELAYESLFLHAFTGLELLIQELFVNLLCERATHPRPCRPLQVFPSLRTAQTIIEQGGYVDWLPLEKLEKLSKVFFKATGNPAAGNPFLAGINQPAKHELAQCRVIRNYIAHKSDHAKRELLERVISAAALPGKRRDLLTYLRHPHTATESKYDYHVGAIFTIARSFCT